MWGQLLNMVDVSTDDDFFAAGGHSLLAMQLASLIASHFSVRVGMGTLIAHSSLASMASLIDTLRAEAAAQVAAQAAGGAAAGSDSAPQGPQATAEVRLLSSACMQRSVCMRTAASLGDLPAVGPLLCVHTIVQAFPGCWWRCGSEGQRVARATGDR